MSTKVTITLNIEDGLSRQEMDDLRYVLSDALGEFSARRTPADGYVKHTYGKALDDDAQTAKIKEVRRRTSLADKLLPMILTYEHMTPHTAMAIADYYKSCEEDDLPAMSAALWFLPAAQFGERKGWLVLREQDALVIQGPDEQRAFWSATDKRWQWLVEGASLPEER
jgi:hypothetical protein